MANWADRILAVVNTFTGRPSPTDTSAAYQVRAATVNENFQGNMLAVAVCQALGTECTDNTSTAILCKLKITPGRFAPGDRLTIIEDRPTLRTWCKVVTGTGAVPLVEFADADLQDSALAGTADYDTIQADLLLVQVCPLDKATWPKQAILVGGQHGLTGTVIPWQFGNVQTIEAKLLAAVGPAGGDGEVQFNDAGNMGGASKILYDKFTGSTSVGTGSTFSGLNSLCVGASHVASGVNSLSVGQACETAGAASRSLAQGKEAKATLPNQLAHAGGKIVVVGDNQFGRVPAGLATSDAALHVLYSLPLAAGTTYTVRGLVTARTAMGASCGWKFEGVCENTGGTARDIAAFAVAAIGADAGSAAWVLAVATNAGTKTLDVTVQNPGGVPLNWGMTMEWEEVAL